jgi:integrase
MSRASTRRRKAFLQIGGKKFELHAPGLRVVSRGTSKDIYWACCKGPQFKAYKPRTVRIHADLDVSDPNLAEALIAQIEEICEREQQAMLSWADGHVDDNGRLKPKFDGTIGSLVALYMSDDESGYQRLKQNSQNAYADWLRIVLKTIGLRTLARIQPKFFRTCYDEWRMRDDEDEESGKTRRAYGCIQMVKVLLNYGIEAAIPHAQRLREGMETIRFERNPPRGEAMTYAFSSAFVEYCLAKGDWRMALCQALPWDTGLRQIDVIGQWRREPDTYRPKPGEIRCGSRVWSGLTLNRIVADGELLVRTSKTSQPVAHRIAKCDLVMRCIPYIDRVSPHAPVALNSRGQPWADHRAFGKAWRRYANAAGVPATTWNMDNRAGAISEGSAGGASDDDLAVLAGHAKKTTTQRIYKRRLVEASDRVQAKRREARVRTG